MHEKQLEVDKQKARKFLTDFSKNYNTVSRIFWSKRRNPNQSEVLSTFKMMSSLDFQAKKSQVFPVNNKPEIELTSPSLSPRRRESHASKILPRDREKFKSLVSLAGELGDRNLVGLIRESDDDDFEEYSLNEIEQSATNVYFSPLRVGSTTLQKHNKEKIDKEERKVDVKCYDMGMLMIFSQTSADC